MALGSGAEGRSDLGRRGEVSASLGRRLLSGLAPHHFSKRSDHVATKTEPEIIEIQHDFETHVQSHHITCPDHCPRDKNKESSCCTMHGWAWGCMQRQSLKYSMTLKTHITHAHWPLPDHCPPPPPRQK